MKVQTAWFENETKKVTSQRYFFPSSGEEIGEVKLMNEKSKKIDSHFTASKYFIRLNVFGFLML